MRCQYLEEVVMRYCKAYPVRKMIPASSSQLVSPCFTNYETCPVYQEKMPIVEEAPPRPEEKEGKAEAPEINHVSIEQKYCVWLRQEIVSYRLCTRNYNCRTCQFEQMLADRNGKYVEPLEVVQEIEQLRELPASQRKCKYMVTGKVLYQRCHMDYECWRCPIYQRIRDTAVATYIKEAKEQPLSNQQ